MIAQLDLVICVDTAIAHLAGALGKPVWLMLPEIGDFRWLEGREDSPWYPTMRLFRQRVLGEWDEVIARVKDALQEAATSGSLLEPVRAPATSLSDRCESLRERTVTAVPAAIARVAETRYGILQYLPGLDDAAQSLAWYGEYLQPQLELLSRLIRPGAHVVEAGSGIGEHAITLAKLVGVEGHVIAYETRPIVQQILRQNLEANRVSGTVTLMRRGLSGPRRGSRDYPDDAVGVPAATAPDAPIDTDTLDELLLDRLDLLKIRSGANAADILQGASDTLWRLRPLLFLSAADVDAIDFLAERAGSFGYRCWRMEVPCFDPDNFNRRDVDILDGAVGWALLAIPEEMEVPLPFGRCIELTDAGRRSGTINQANGDSQSRSPVAEAEDDNSPTGFGRLLRKLRG